MGVRGSRVREKDWKAFRDPWMARKNGFLSAHRHVDKGGAKDTKRNVGQRVNELKTKLSLAVDATLVRIQSGRLLQQAPPRRRSTSPPRNP